MNDVSYIFALASETNVLFVLFNNANERRFKRIKDKNIMINIFKYKLIFNFINHYL